MNTERFPNNPLDLKLRDLMAKSLAGDKSAYERLLTEAAVLLRGYFRKSLAASGRSLDEAEDLVQEVLVSLHTKKHLYDVKRPFLPWLFAVARYRLIDQRRAEKRRIQTNPWEEWYDPPETGKGIEAGDLEEALSPLTDRQREIIKLAKLEGLSLAEVAVKMNMSISSVKVTVHRAMKILWSKNKEGK